MFTREAAKELYARLFKAMSEAEAKDILGFPPMASPSDREVNKALRVMAPQFHPDRGGDPRKMVELNVAADILKGKRQPDGTSPAPAPRRDPEAEKRQQEELQRRQDLDFLILAKKMAVSATQRMVESVSLIKSSWHLNLRNYLTNELASNLDALQAASDKALRDRDIDPKHKRIWQQFDKGSEIVGARALRTATRTTKLWRNLKLLSTSEGVSVKDLDALWDEVDEYKDVFHAFSVAFGKFVTTLTMSDTDDFIDSKMYDDIIDPIHTSFSMTSSFDDHFQSIKRHDDGGKNVKKAVLNAQKILKRRKIKVPAKKWDDWRVPEDFDKAIDEISSGYKTACNVVRRCQRS
jgi:hypothetical protein